MTKQSKSLIERIAHKKAVVSAMNGVIKGYDDRKKHAQEQADFWNNRVAQIDREYKDAPDIRDVAEKDLAALVRTQRHAEVVRLPVCRTGREVDKKKEQLMLRLKRYVEAGGKLPTV